MQYPEYRWVDVAYGGVNKRNNVVTLDKIQQPEDIPDCYRTVYRYPDMFKEYYDNNKTVGGYNGPVYADFIPIDIDAEDDIGKAHELAKKALNTIMYSHDVDLGELWIYFSGCKGFHILIPAAMVGYEPSVDLPDRFKIFVSKLLPDTEIDLTIYDKLRLFRLSNTKHSKSKLYKIPLEAREVLYENMEWILQTAKEPRELSIVREHNANISLQALFDSSTTEKEKHKDTEAHSQGSQGPSKFAKMCYHDILKGVGQGERDNCALRLAVHFKDEGYEAEIIMAMLSAWNRKNKPSLDKKEIEKAVKQAFEKPYDFGCNDPVLEKHCDPRCYIKNSKGKNEHSKPEEKMQERIYSIEDAYKKYSEYIRQISERKINIGIPLLDEFMRGIAPGEACQIMARAGVGKTALMLNILSNVILSQGIPSLVFSLEMPVAQIFERMVQIANAKEGKQVERAWSEDEETAAAWFSNTVRCFGSSFIIDDDFISIDEVYRYFEIAQKKIGKKPSFVCLDYLGRMNRGSYSTYEGTSELALRMKNLARELDVALLYLHQTSRAGGDGTIKITMDMARDSGVIEEASDFMIGLWRPDMTTKEAQKSECEQMKVALLKNRKGPNGTVTMMFHKKSLIIDTEEGLHRRGLLA